MRLKPVFEGIGLGVMALCAQSALAAGFQINEMSSALQGEALAGAAAVTNDPSAMAYNPATLATVKDTQIQLGASYIVPDIGYTDARDSYVIGGATFQKTHGITAESSIAPPAFVPAGYFATTLPQNFHVGLAITAPWGLSTQYNPDWVGSAHAVNSSIVTTDVAPTLAWQVNQYFALGAALHAQYAQADYSSNIFFDTPATFDLNSDLSGNSWGFGYSVGMLLTPFDTTNIGISYRSKIHQNLTGNASINGTIPGHTFAIASEPASAVITMPEVINIGLSQKVTDRFTALAGAQWTGWQSMQSLNAYSGTTSLFASTLNWTPAWLYSIGGQYQLTDQWVLRSGVAYDSTPTVDQYRDPRIPDTNRYWLAFGAGYTPVQNILLNFAYEHIFMQNQSVNVVQDALPGVPSTVSANYTGSADIFASSITWTF